jgi:hypothetical protein
MDRPQACRTGRDALQALGVIETTLPLAPEP